MPLYGMALLHDVMSLLERLPVACRNTRLSERYLALARDLDVMEPKTPEDVYKMQLVEGRTPAGGTTGAPQCKARRIVVTPGGA